MKTGIISDVHSNMEALQAVLEDLQQENVDEIVCLGDCVGYGADPEACLDLLFESCSVIIAGNHDLAAAGKLDGRRFTSLARFSVNYTRDRLRPDQLKALGELPAEVERDGILFVHASPVSPLTFPYIKEPELAAKVFQAREFRIAFYGHTHLPLTFHHREGGEVSVSLNPRVDLSPRGSYLINVGSVGQPRDSDPRACYALFDDAELSLRLRRVAYDTAAASDRIHAEGLPEALGRRLLVGI